MTTDQAIPIILSQLTQTREDLISNFATLKELFRSELNATHIKIQNLSDKLDKLEERQDRIEQAHRLELAQACEELEGQDNKLASLAEEEHKALGDRLLRLEQAEANKALADKKETGATVKAVVVTGVVTAVLSWLASKLGWTP